MTSSTTETPALVFGAGLTVLGTIRSLGRAGVPVLCAHKQPPWVEASRWCRYPEFGTLPIAPDECVPALEASPLRHAVAIPCSDHWCHEIAGWSEERRRRFPTSVVAQSVLDTLVDKNAFADALRRLGLPHPWTRHVTSDADVSALGSEIPANSFLKPCDSQAFNRQFQRKAFSTTSVEDLREKLGRIRAAGLECIIQEYVPGPPTNHYFVDGFVDHQGRITALVARQRIRMYPVDFGNSTMLVSVPLDEVRGAVDTIRGLVDGLGYRGIFSAEFKKDERDQVFRILEVNCRPWWFVEFATMCGVDVVTMAYRDALRLPLTPVESYASGVRYCYMTFDKMAYQHLKARGEISRVGWIRSWLFGRHAVFSTSDLGPALQPLRQRVRDRWRLMTGQS
jgi:predicted ATP-grasp superfamily ATP-dependent carboligase